MYVFMFVVYVFKFQNHLNIIAQHFIIVYHKKKLLLFFLDASF